MNATPAGPTPPRRRGRAGIYGLTFCAVAAAGIFLWTSFDRGGCTAEAPSIFATVYALPSAAMEPFLRQGEAVLAERRYYCRRDPKRGDVAIFAAAAGAVSVSVMRIVGLPGDRVALRAGVLYLNGAPVERDWLESAIHADADGNPRPETRAIEHLPGGASYVVVIGDEAGAAENLAEVTVPPGQYLLLADNRDQATQDGTAAPINPVPRALIADRPAFVVWSHDLGRIGRDLR